VTAGARIGLIVPSSNPTIEGFVQHVPVAALLGIDVLVTRVRVRRIAADADADAQFGLTAMSAAAALLAEAEVSLVAWAGTSGFWLGGTREDGVLARASADAGVPVTSSRVAVLAALAERPGVPVGVLTPYVPEIHGRVVAAVMTVIEAELRRLAGLGAESLAVVCTNVLGSLPGLADAPFVVVDSVLATLWHAARLSGCSDQPYADCYRKACRLLAGAGPGRPGAGPGGVW
jgi:maleate isomerase